MSSPVQHTHVQDADVAIIGAGPVGLFAIFECGMLRMKCHVIDALDVIGGQCAALYPEKPIYDIPGYPSIDAADLIERLNEQSAPFAPVYHLGQQVVSLTPADGGLIRAADTFFLGTTNPERGSDTSHRGGRPGFVRVDGGRLWWRDYPGNNLFNSFGNLAVNPEAALFFADFDTGRTLHLSGTAEIEWDERGRPGDEGHTGRRAVFTPERLVAGHLLPSRQVAHSPNPRNPALTD